MIQREKKYAPKVLSALKTQVPQQAKKRFGVYQKSCFQGEKKENTLHQSAFKVFVGDPFAQYLVYRYWPPNYSRGRRLLLRLLVSKCSATPARIAATPPGARRGVGGPNYPRQPTGVFRMGCDRALLRGCSCDTPATPSKLRKEPRRGCSYTLERGGGGGVQHLRHLGPRRLGTSFSDIQSRFLGRGCDESTFQ